MTVKATILGQEITLTYNSQTGKYEASITAPTASSYQNNEGHYFPVSVTATDEAGNSTTISDTAGSFAEKLKLYVKEQIKPTVSGMTPSSGANIATVNPTIEFNILDNSNGQTSGFSGVNPDSVVLTVGGVAVDSSLITKTPITGGYKCSYTPSAALADGNCSVSAKVSDFDGNESDTATVTFKIDTAPPVLQITYPENGTYVNDDILTVLGKTSDITSSPVTVTVKVGDVDQGEVSIADDGSFSKQITLKDGLNTITVQAKDSAGQISTVTRTVTLKTTKPVFTSVEIAPNPVDCGKTYTICVAVS